MLADSEYRDPWMRYRQVSGELIAPECRSILTLRNSNSEVTNWIKTVNVVVWPTRMPNETGISLDDDNFDFASTLEFMPNEFKVLIMSEKVNDAGFTWSEPLPEDTETGFRCVDKIVDPNNAPFVTGYIEVMF
jgi:hypothetical protein